MKIKPAIITYTIFRAISYTISGQHMMYDNVAAPQEIDWYWAKTTELIYNYTRR